MMGDQREDLVAEGVDVALRFGPLSDSTATVRRILAWPRVLAASRAYLDKAGAPHLRVWPGMRSFLGPQALVATNQFAEARCRDRTCRLYARALNACGAPREA
jgi:DNA-binding transcriptional LysR family regulator